MKNAVSIDTLQKFMFDQAPVRGAMVEISQAWRQVQARCTYPEPVNNLLGEMLSAAALLSGSLKFDGTVIMQIHGDGPVRLLVVECNSNLQLRATAKLTSDTPISDDAGLHQLVDVHGKGRFVITLDPNNKLPGQQAYQGIVPLDGNSIASVIENYMKLSEQLETRLWLAANDQVSRGLFMQCLPANAGHHAYQDTPPEQADTWQRATLLGSTLGRRELLETDIETLLRRLFWEETVHLFEARHPSFHCTCNREKVGNMLKMLGRAEVDASLDDQGMLGINCDFCGQGYEFDKVDCAQLFASDEPVEALLPASNCKH